MNAAAATGFSEHTSLLSAWLSTEQEQGAKVLGTPIIFLRKWLGSALTEVLNSDALLFVWDQCFILGWHVLEQAATAILLLLRADLLKATSYQQLRKILLQQPAKLYTRDVVAAWKHLKSGLELSQIRALNSQNGEILATEFELSAEEVASDLAKQESLFQSGVDVAPTE